MSNPVPTSDPPPGPGPAAGRRDPPYGIIASALRRGGVVPFLGAGVNFGTRPEKAGWTRDAAFLPAGSELARYLADECKFPSDVPHDRGDLAKVASYFAEAGGRNQLRDFLRAVFDRDYAPGDIHTCLAEVAADRPMLIITTNYDDLLERAFAGLRYDLVSHITVTDRDDWGEAVLYQRHDPAGGAPARDPEPMKPQDLAARLDLRATTVIYKMHGAVDRQPASEWDSYVITEDDYVDFLSRMTKNSAVPSAVPEHCGQRQFLFLGYGLGDWNLRVVLRDLFANRSRRVGKSWAIQRFPSPLEDSLWESRRVDIYDVDINEFARELRRHIRPPADPAAAAAAPVVP